MSLEPDETVSLFAAGMVTKLLDVPGKFFVSEDGTQIYLLMPLSNDLLILSGEGFDKMTEAQLQRLIEDYLRGGSQFLHGV